MIHEEDRHNAGRTVFPIVPGKKRDAVRVRHANGERQALGIERRKQSRLAHLQPDADLLKYALGVLGGSPHVPPNTLLG